MTTLSWDSQLGIGLAADSMVRVGPTVVGWDFSDLATLIPRVTITGRARVRVLNHRSATIRFTVDDTDVTSPILFGRSGHTLHVQLSESPSNSVGAHQRQQFSGPMTVSTAQTQSGLLQFQVTVVANLSLTSI